MQNDLKYQVRSREIIDLVGAMRNSQLVLTPYFQRNLVWRDTHKRDFIETILKGFPFPQIFVARGSIDIETMVSSTCVVDGQQRLTAIRDYVADGFSVNGKKFSELAVKERENFLKYEVAVIDFDLDANDEKLKEIFRRLNRTFYSLSEIERIATEFSASQFLLVARVLSGDIAIAAEQDRSKYNFEESEVDENLDQQGEFSRDPGIGEEKWQWLRQKAGGAYSDIIGNQLIFSIYEAQRKVPLMFVLNVMCTIMAGYYNRNGRVREYLERYAENFEVAESIIGGLNSIGIFVQRMNLPQSSMWWNKANFFTMIIQFWNNIDQLTSPEDMAAKMQDFELNIPPDYSLAAREAVNTKAQRLVRAQHLNKLLNFGVVN